MNVFEEFESRGMIYGATQGARDVLASGKVTGYVGFDPTSSSLHVGSLLPLMALARLQRVGNSPLAVIGGGTGLIGDPSGKTRERALLTKADIEMNLEGIKSQLERFLDFDERQPNAARIINNAEWLTRLNLLDFLRDIGKHFTIKNMITKDSVSRRLELEEGISFTEFSYQVLQAYDFLQLYDRFGCTLQMGGSDQWGNITAGCDLLWRERRVQAHGVVFPLVTSASGVKFGKTEEGTVWLDAARTSPFRFYQFWLNTDDRDVITYLKFFTFLSLDQISDLRLAVSKQPERREAQRVLASDVTRLVHGDEHLQRAERASSLLFSERISELNANDVLEMFDDVPSTRVDRQRFVGEGVSVVELLASVKLVPSKSEATRLIRSGGIYVNNQRVGDDRARLTLEQAIAGRVFVLRKGQKQTHLVKIG